MKRLPIDRERNVYQGEVTMHSSGKKHNEQQYHCMYIPLTERIGSVRREKKAFDCLSQCVCVFSSSPITRDRVTAH